MSGCVTVTGPPASICLLKIGITDPLLPSTLPKRTATNSVWVVFNASIISGEVITSRIP